MSAGMFALHVVVSTGIVLATILSTWITVIYPKFVERAPSQGR